VTLYLDTSSLVKLYVAEPGSESVRGLVDGSSPRLRGTREYATGLAFRKRFIPAPAGNTRPYRPRHLSPSVHPRACGEHYRTSPSGSRASGSSQRLRGTHVYRATSKDYGSVHPRACGEHSYRRLRPRRSSGSSPRLRGTRGTAIGAGAGARFIPAPAGNTLSPQQRSVDETVHPRACGEHQPPCTAPQPSIRFIPAPAGNTLPGHDCFHAGIFAVRILPQVWADFRLVKERLQAMVRAGRRRASRRRTRRECGGSSPT
jgi:hypothetical protein